VRALEVLETTGRRFSSFGSGLTEYGPPAFDVGLVGVWLPRAELGRRIAERFAAMRAGGLEAEVRALTRVGDSLKDSPDGDRSRPAAPYAPPCAPPGDSLKDSLQRGGGGLSRTAAQAIGYKEILAFLNGEIPSLEQAFDLAVRRTRQFARRQRVWFRRDPRIRWVGTARNPQDLAPVVLALWGRTAATVAANRT
jgi:tRNA dimethylallyltransferase